MAGFRPRTMGPPPASPEDELTLAAADADLGVTGRLPPGGGSPGWVREPIGGDPTPGPAPAARAPFRPRTMGVPKDQRPYDPLSSPRPDPRDVPLRTGQRSAGPEEAPSIGALSDVQREKGVDVDTAYRPSLADPAIALLRTVVPGFDQYNAHRLWVESGGKLPDEAAITLARHQGKGAQAANPGITTAGEVLPMVFGAGEAKGLAGVAKRVVPQALYAGAKEAGLSEAPTLGGKAADAAKAGGRAALYALGGEGVMAGLRKLGPLALGAARRAGRRFLSGNVSPLSVERPLSDAAVDAARREGAIRAGSTIARGDRVLSEVRKQAGEDVGAVAGGLEGAGFEASAPRALGGEFDTRGAQIADMSDAASPRPKLFEDAAENLWPFKAEKKAQAEIDAFPTPIQQAMRQAQAEVDRLQAQAAKQGIPVAQRWPIIAQKMQTFQPTIEQPPPMPRFDSPKSTLPSGNLRISQQLGMERDAQTLAQDAYRALDGTKTLAGNAQVEKAAIYNRALNDQIAAQASKDPALAAAWTRVNQRFGPIADASDYAADSAARFARQNKIGLTELLPVVGGLGSAFSGGGARAAIGGAGSALLLHLLKTRGSSTGAALAYNTAAMAPALEKAVQLLTPVVGAEAARRWAEEQAKQQSVSPPGVQR
jgi:hypothetical protein